MREPDFLSLLPSICFPWSLDLQGDKKKIWWKWQVFFLGPRDYVDLSSLISPHFIPLSWFPLPFYPYLHFLPHFSHQGTNGSSLVPRDCIDARNSTKQTSNWANVVTSLGCIHKASWGYPMPSRLLAIHCLNPKDNCRISLGCYSLLFLITNTSFETLWRDRSPTYTLCTDGVY